MIAGVGLIGGSIASAIRKRQPQIRVVGLVRDAARYAAAVECGLLHDVVEQPTDVDGVDLAVACTPVDRIVPTLTAVHAAHPTALLTDAGSTKVTVARKGRSLAARFVPAHPLAGSERTGWQWADADLFEGKVCLLTPISGESPSIEVADFWRALGMTLLPAAPEDHDRWLAFSSHLPHLAAAALVNAIDAPRDIRATGYRDTTRIAAGSAEVWTAIVRENAGPIRDAIADLVRELTTVDSSIAEGDFDAVHEWLARAAAERRGDSPVEPT